MKQFLLFFLLSAALCTVNAQTKTINDKNAQPRNVKGFHGIKVSSGIHLYLTQGNEEAVAVSANAPEYVDRIRTEVENGILRIYYDRRSNNDDNRSLKAYVSCKTLDRLDGNSGAEVEIDGSLKSDNLSMEFTSGASFDGRLETGGLKVDQNSGSEMKMSGTARSLTMDGSSGASFKGYDLETESASVDVSSGATIRVTVKSELKAVASSGGQVYYKGNGVIKDISTSSGGEVSKR